MAGVSACRGARSFCGRTAGLVCSEARDTGGVVLGRSGPVASRRAVLLLQTPAPIACLTARRPCCRFSLWVGPPAPQQGASLCHLPFRSRALTLLRPVANQAPPRSARLAVCLALTLPPASAAHLAVRPPHPLRSARLCRPARRVCGGGRARGDVACGWRVGGAFEGGCGCFWPFSLWFTQAGVPIGAKRQDLLSVFPGQWN